MLGIFAIDPGIKTGVAWVVVDERLGTVGDCLRETSIKWSTTIEGSEMEQADHIFNLWQNFRNECLRMRIKHEDVHLVIEDFILYPGAHAGGKDGVAPARYGWAFEGYRLGRSAKYHREKHVIAAVWQSSNAIKNRKLLKKWDCWIVGKEHERAAFCHVGERLRKLIR